jgi:hypothetical protein
MLEKTQEGNMMATTFPQRTIRRIASMTVGVVMLAVPACTSSDHGASRPTSTVAPTTAQPRPAGPAADLSTELSGGHGVIMGEGVSTDLRRVGYVQREFLAVGTATSYKVAGALTGDGRWTFVPDASAPYRTRVLVRAPAKAGAFSGTVIVEWLNVSGGVDADPEWVSTQEEITRTGDAWVGVSAQRIGVEGGPVLVKVPDAVPGADLQGKGLKAVDPARYGTLEHPGDGYSSAPAPRAKETLDSILSSAGRSSAVRPGSSNQMMWYPNPAWTTATQK